MRRLVILLITLAFILSGCAEKKVKSEHHIEYADPVESTNIEYPYNACESLQSAHTERSEDEYVFSVSADAFVDEFNSLCRGEFGDDYLSPIGEWMTFDDNSIFTGKEAVRYEFKTSLSNYIEPTIWIYIPKDDKRITMISIQFDDHGYAQWAYDVYRDYASYTLKAFLNHLSEEDIEKIFENLNDAAYSDRCFVSPGERPCPMVLYYRDNVGLFAYYRSGMVHFCVIPVSAERLTLIRNNGAELIEIRN